VISPADPVALMKNILADGLHNGRIRKIAFSNEVSLIENIYNKVMSGSINEKIKLLNGLK